MRDRPGTGLSAHSTRLRLYVRQPGGWFWRAYQPQHINNLYITTVLTHQDSCQVVCFFIGPGGYDLPQYADNQHYQSFITCQVVWNFGLRIRKSDSPRKRKESLFNGYIIISTVPRRGQKRRGWRHRTLWAGRRLSWLCCATKRERWRSWHSR